MSGVDDRIVSMKFDNSAFQSKLADTLKSLDKLKSSLNFSGSAKGMTDLSAATKGFSLAGMSSAVEGVSGKFLALSTIGITALATLTSKAVIAGAQMLKSMTLAPLMDGFKEYETNMNSIQTILANTDSKGSTLQNVNDALDQLNTYSDQTIYNFGEMARNIGTFTAAGVDLDTSVSAIKGIANLAAISGSNSEQASTAMYQLSQAMASGTVKLMDWNSVVNAGMGGEIFQKSLFESGKAMKTLSDVPMDMTFEEWTDAGNTFRGSLESGWLTGEVLTNTLQGFTGDLTEAQIMAMGYTQAQAAEMMRLGKIGKAAATEVKTLSQLMGTVKESIASGWSSSFRILVGDFNEAKELFTGINTAVGDMISRSADARNKVLQDWKDLGGRDLLIQGFKDALSGLGTILAPIKEAFRDIFPPATGQTIFDLTQKFANFAKSIAIGGETADKIKSIFSGLFSIIKIGWGIVKGLVQIIGDLIGKISSGSGGVFTFIAHIADMVTAFQEAMIAGGGLEDFFDGISAFIENPLKYLRQFKEYLLDLFAAGGFPGAEILTAIFGRLSERFEQLSGTAEKVGDAFNTMGGFFDRIRPVLDEVLGHLKTWFSELGAKLAEAIHPGDFDAAVDAVNVGLLGGIVILLKKFLSGGLDLNFGGGLMDKVTDALDGLTGTLKAMQTDIKADALMKIAIAVGILAASIVVLSLIDSAALTKALVAISVSFGILLGVMKLMEGVSFSLGGAKLGILAAGMILLSTSVLILAAAIKILSTLSWSELAKGLIGVAVAMGLLVVAVRLMSADPAGLIRAGVAMMAIAVALNILALAVKSFAELSWGEMAKGFVGVAVGLGLIVAAMNLMPVSQMVLQGAALILIAAGLRILAEAVQAFSGMSWGEMAKGFAGVAAGLLIIAGAMWLMPPHMVAQAAAILVLSAALTIMAKAVEIMGAMDFGQLAKGIGGFAAMLLILAVALNVMSGTIGGAAALVVAAAALVILTAVLKTLGGMKIAELAVGLGAIAAVLAILGIGAALLTPVIPALFALGVALSLVGVSFALFGVGAMLVAKAFETLARSGTAGIAALIEGFKLLLGALPEFISAIIAAIVELATDILEVAPVIMRVIQAVLDQILETVVDMVPQIAEALSTIITAGLMLIREHFPEVMATGLVLMMTFLQGIRDNIHEIATVVGELITNFLTALVVQVPLIVEAGVALLVAFLGALSSQLGLIIQAGVDLLTNFLLGIAGAVGQIVGTIELIISQIIIDITAGAQRIITLGTNLLIWLMSGISTNISKVIDAVAEIITTFITDLGARANEIIEAGLGVLTDFLQGIGDNISDVVTTGGEVVTEFVTAIGAAAQKVITAGADALVDFLTGVENNIGKVATKAADVVIAFVNAIGAQAIRVTVAAADMLIDFLNGLASAIRAKSGELREAGRNVAGAIIEGMTGGLSARAGEVARKAVDIARSAVSAATGFLGITSPSKVFYEIGTQMATGMALGLDDDHTAETAAARLANNVTDKLKTSLAAVDIGTAISEDFVIEPVIRPVIDLTKGHRDAIKKWNLEQSLKPTIDLTKGHRDAVAKYSYDQAREIATTRERVEIGDAKVETQQVSFVQNINSPTALSTSDIYRNTKSQIALAKEELSIA